MSPSRVLIHVAAVASLLAACAAQPPARPVVSTLPPLDPAAARVLIASGMMNRGDPQGATLSSLRQVGPVYFDGRFVGSTAQNEYFVIDVKPGTYNVACSPQEPVKNLNEQRKVSFVAGETKSLVCEMAPARGDLAEEYRSKTYLEERAIEPTSVPVGYTKLP